jgi:outer membrane protein OmpA-like peptidoglycan-associated protein
MQRKVIVLLVSGLLATTTGWTAEKNRANKEESIGLGSGAAIGALAGGPVGLIVGAAFGGWLGDRFHHERRERAATEERYGEAEAKAASLQGRLAGKEHQVNLMEAQITNERVAHRQDLQEALSIEIFFRTEDSTLDGATEQRLAELAELLGPMDGTVVRLQGYTDARGTTEYNDQLAATRASAVRDALMRAGMPAERIVVTAAGESAATATEQDADGMALERRVELSIVDMGDSSRVARQAQD